MKRSRKDSLDDEVRIWIKVDAATRRLIRIAAAYADLEVAEWAADRLKEAAQQETGADQGTVSPK
jgi:hypothetical protein